MGFTEFSLVKSWRNGLKSVQAKINKVRGKKRTFMHSTLFIDFLSKSTELVVGLNFWTKQKNALCLIGIYEPPTVTGNKHV